MSKQQQAARAANAGRGNKYSNKSAGRRRGAVNRRQYGVVIGVVVGLVVLIGAIWLVSVAMSPSPAYGARYVADQGRAHIQAGEAHPPYNTTPPTSGWHYEAPAEWGVYDRPVADEVQVHNLEHGGIMIQYWCPDGCATTVESLQVLVERYPSKVILAPYARPLENRIALTAWRWVDTFDEFDEARIVDFIARHKDQGPEKVMD